MIHYPTPIDLADSTSSSSLHAESARRINSTPTLQNGGVSRSSSRRGIRDRGSKCSSLNRPLSLADSRHPIIDISSLDYKAYRHRLIDATLRKQYDLQPPGDVVLNSLHLNSADSVIGIRLNDQYDHSLFDFVEEYYDAGATSRENDERHHPLDHFLPRGAARPPTSEKETETISDDGVDRENGRNHLPGSIGNPPKLPGMDDNGNPCVRAPPYDVSAIATGDRDPRSEVPISRRSIPTRSRKRADKTTPGHGAEDDCPRPGERSSRRESSWPRNDRPASAGNASKIFSLPRAAVLPGNREATGSPRPETSASRSRWESKKKLEDDPPAVLSLSGGRLARGRNFISVSSSEIASDSSKRRDDEVSCRSRESSISPRSRASTRPPWLSGSRGTSFNRKYGRNITEISARRVARPTRPATRSARGSDPPGAVSSQGRSKKSSASLNRNPGRRATSFVESGGRELVGMTTERQGENLATRPRGQRSKSQDGSVAAADNEEGRTLKTADSPSGEKMFGGGTTLPGALSFLSSPARTLDQPRKRSPRDAFSATTPASKTSATKKPELISRCGTDSARGRPAPGNNASRARPVTRDRLAKLNRGGRRQLKSVENPSKSASLSPQIELSAEVLNPADKSAIHPDGEKLAGLTPRIDSRESTESDRIRAENDAISNGASDDARSRVPKIMRNLRTRPASANNLGGGRRPAAASHPALRDANSETKSGLNDTKLNTRSNGAADEMRYDESPSAEASSLAPRGCGNVAGAEGMLEGDVAGRGADEELQLPRHDSKIGLAMNSALRRYIKMLKQGLLNHGKDGVALASLSLSDAVSVLSKQRTPLSPEETRELQTVLDKIERNPELLCKLSCASIESIV